MERDSNGGFLYALTAGIAVGVALALTFTLGVEFIAVCIGLASVLITLGAFARYRLAFLAAIFCAALALGVLRADAFLLEQQRNDLLPFVTAGKEKTIVEGVVTNDPERRATSLHVSVDVSKINDQPVGGTLLAILDRDEPVVYGDLLILEGKIEEPQAFETSTDRVFDYKGYLKARGISALMKRPRVLEVLGGNQNGFQPNSPFFIFQSFLFDTKHLFERSVEKLFPEPDGSLLEGILLGERRGIPQSLTDAFVASSLVHVVVLSGHNITIVSEAVFRALVFLPRTASFGVGGVLMILFALMTGAGATTVRALIMALVALLARYLHRSALALRSLAAAATGMILWNPSSLLHDPSFILSVLATFGLITLAPWVEKKIKRVPNYTYFDLRSIVATTIAVEIFVTPALLYLSGVLSIFALPANILALPVVPLAMLAGFVAGVVGLFSPTLALLPTLVCDLFLKWLMLVATTTEALPYSTATVATFPIWILFVVYVPLTYFAVHVYIKDSKN